MTFLIDMNLSPRWCDFFSGQGFKAVHWSAVGSPAASDNEIFSRAKLDGYVIMTHDLDFSVLLALSRDDGPSVVQLRTMETSPDKIALQVIGEIKIHSASLESGAILTIDLIRSRVRTLPI